MKTEAEIKKFRETIMENLTTASLENIKWLQGCIYGLDYPNKKEEKDD